MKTSSSFYLLWALFLSVIVGLGVLLFRPAQQPEQTSEASERLYGKVIEVTGSTVSNYFVDVVIVWYVDCDKTGKSSFDDGTDKETIRRLYAKPAISSGRLMPRVGDTVVLLCIDYKSVPTAMGIDHYNNITIAIPEDSAVPLR